MHIMHKLSDTCDNKGVLTCADRCPTDWNRFHSPLSNQANVPCPVLRVSVALLVPMPWHPQIIQSRKTRGKKRSDAPYSSVTCSFTHSTPWLPVLLMITPFEQRSLASFSLCFVCQDSILWRFYVVSYIFSSEWPMTYEPSCRFRLE